MQSITQIRPQQEVQEGEIKVTNIDASQLANGQVIHIPQTMQQSGQPISIAGAQGQQITLIPASALAGLTAQQAGSMMRSVNLGNGVMQLQPAGGLSAANGFLQSIPVQNIPGLGNVQVISAVQPTTVQTLQSTATSAAPTVHIESTNDPKWQILQTINSNGSTTISAQQQTQQQAQVQQQPQQSQQQHSNASASGDDTNKQHRRRVACTCPNCGDGDR